MASIKEVRHLLRHIDANVERKSKGRFPVVYRNNRFTVKESDVDKYLSLQSDLRFGAETSIGTSHYYEHAVEFQGFRGMPPRFRMGRGEALELENKDQTEKISLGIISPILLFAILDQDEPHRDVMRFLMRPIMSRYRDHDEEVDITHLFRIYTIQISIDRENGKPITMKKGEGLAESALFHFAYNHGFASILSQSWEREFFRLGRRRSEVTQYPLRTYSSDLLAYYQLALGSESMILAYLALYKIVEYFYTSASEKVLHGKIKDKLVLPDFHHTRAKQLRELVSLIRKNDQKTDERRMLINVLEEYFEAEELKDWLDDFEADGENYYTTQRELFGEKHKIDTAENQIFPSIASRIYHIRNAIVHNKEGELSRFIPFSGQEQMLFREMPLLRFIAEGLIIKTGKDI